MTPDSPTPPWTRLICGTRTCAARTCAARRSPTPRWTAPRWPGRGACRRSCCRRRNRMRPRPGDVAPRARLTPPRSPLPGAADALAQQRPRPFGLRQIRLLGVPKERGQFVIAGFDRVAHIAPARLDAFQVVVDQADQVVLDVRHAGLPLALVVTSASP